MLFRLRHAFAFLVSPRGVIWWVQWLASLMLGCIAGGLGAIAVIYEIGNIQPWVFKLPWILGMAMLVGAVVGTWFMRVRVPISALGREEMILVLVCSFVVWTLLVSSVMSIDDPRMVTPTWAVGLGCCAMVLILYFWATSRPIYPGQDIY